MKNKILVYDDNCPLCTWYTSLFVKYGWLPAEGRLPFSALDPAILKNIDFDRSRNEIPLLDNTSGKVKYGIDALLDILGERSGFIKTVGNIRPVKWCLKRLYRFISYNRKVIVAKKCGTGTIDCSPDMNYFYRFLFLFVFLAFNTVMLFPLHTIVFSRFKDSVVGLQVAHFLLVGVNCTLAFRFSKNKAFEYLGQVNMLALATILLLIPLMIIRAWFDLPNWLLITYLGGLSVFIFKEYLRRMEYAGVLPADKWVASINLVCLMAFLLFVFH